MKRRPTKKMIERQLSALCTDMPGASAESRVFSNKCRSWLELESNRDGRGTKAEATRDVFLATVRFRQALRARSHNDSSIRHTAEKAVTAVRHEEYPALRNRLRTLSGRISKAGRRIAEKRRRDTERVLELDEEHELRELRSVTGLQRVGRALGNCVARQSYAKGYLCETDAELWVLIEKEQDRPLCLLKIDTSTKEVDEVEGADGSTPRLKRRLAFKLLKALGGVSGDDEPAFAQVGAFQAFLVDGQTTVEPIEAEGSLHWVWLLRGGTEVVIATKPRSGKRRWSRFVRHSSETVSPRRRRRRQGGLTGGLSNHLSESELLALVVDHPALAERLRNGAVNDGLEQDPA